MKWMLCFALITIIIFSGCASKSSNVNQNKEGQATNTPAINVPTKNCEPGPYSVSVPEGQYKNEYDAQQTCEDACKEDGAEYKSHLGTDTGTFYSLFQCNCWCGE